jgi:hypothetical protein
VREERIMKWERFYDDEVFDENTIDDAVRELIDEDELYESMRYVMDEVGFVRFFEGLSEELKEKIYDIAYAEVLSEYFSQVDDEDEEDG